MRYPVESLKRVYIYIYIGDVRAAVQGLEKEFKSGMGLH